MYRLQCPACRERRSLTMRCDYGLLLPGCTIPTVLHTHYICIECKHEWVHYE